MNNIKESIPVRSVKTLIADRSVQQSNNLTTKQFFDKYMSCDELMDYIDWIASTPNGSEYTENFFAHIKYKLKIVNTLLTKYDKGGNAYAWLIFSNGVGTKVTLDDAIIAFVKDYQMGVIKPDFDLYDLITEAKKQQVHS